MILSQAKKKDVHSVLLSNSKMFWTILKLPISISKMYFSQNMLEVCSSVLISKKWWYYYWIWILFSSFCLFLFSFLENWILLSLRKNFLLLTLPQAYNSNNVKFVNHYYVHSNLNIAKTEVVRIYNSTEKKKIKIQNKNYCITIYRLLIDSLIFSQTFAMRENYFHMKWTRIHHSCHKNCTCPPELWATQKISAAFFMFFICLSFISL